MNKRTLIILSCFLTCIVLIIGGLLYWTRRPSKEQKLEKYVGRLEAEGYTLEEHPLAEFHVDSTLELYWFSDFRGIARLANTTHIYIDRDRGALYFLQGQNANVFYYTKDFID